MRYPHSLISLLLPALACSCTQTQSDAVTYEVTADIPASKTEPAQQKPSKPQSVSRLTTDKADKQSEPYKLGRKHAQTLHEQCHTTNEIRDELLDINARITNISSRIGPDAANDYLHGMRDYLTETGDTLATVLF